MVSSLSASAIATYLPLPHPQFRGALVQLSKEGGDGIGNRGSSVPDIMYLGRGVFRRLGGTEWAINI